MKGGVVWMEEKERFRYIFRRIPTRLEVSDIQDFRVRLLPS